jgi:hypothetical protein
MKDEPKKSPDSIRPFFLNAVCYDDKSQPVTVSSEHVVSMRPARRTPGATVLLLAGDEERALVLAPYDRVRALFGENGYRILDMNR